MYNYFYCYIRTTFIWVNTSNGHQCFSHSHYTNHNIYLQCQSSYSGIINNNYSQLILPNIHLTPINIITQHIPPHTSQYHISPTYSHNSQSPISFQATASTHHQYQHNITLSQYCIPNTHNPRSHNSITEHQIIHIRNINHNNTIEFSHINTNNNNTRQYHNNHHHNNNNVPIIQSIVCHIHNNTGNFNT